MSLSVACFTGRFQPFHNQHLEVVEALQESFDRVIIGITNPDLAKLASRPESSHRHMDQNNPFDYETRRTILLASLGNTENLEITPFDLDSPQSWQIPAGTTFAIRIFSPWELTKQELFESNGFKTKILSPPSQKLSASSIRESLTVGDDTWQQDVSPGAIIEISKAWQSHVSRNVGAKS